MFERFTAQAREIVVSAQEHARHLGHRHIGTEHLLIALAHTDTRSRALLADHGLDQARVTASTIEAGGSADDAAGDIDAEALGAIGIDLDAVRERVEATFGQGALDRPLPDSGRRKGRNISHIPFTKRAKKTLELSLREAIRLGDKEINDSHLLLALLREGGGLGYRIIVGAGIDIRTLRADIEAGLRAA